MGQVVGVRLEVRVPADRALAHDLAVQRHRDAARVQPVDHPWDIDSFGNRLAHPNVLHDRVLAIDVDNHRFLGLLDDWPAAPAWHLECDVKGKIDLTGLQHGGPHRFLVPHDQS